MKWTVGAVREDEVDDYLQWVRGSGNLMPRHAGPIAKNAAPHPRSMDHARGSSNIMPRSRRVAS